MTDFQYVWDSFYFEGHLRCEFEWLSIDFQVFLLRDLSIFQVTSKNTPPKVLNVFSFDWNSKKCVNLQHAPTGLVFGAYRLLHASCTLFTHFFTFPHTLNIPESSFVNTFFILFYRARDSSEDVELFILKLGKEFLFASCCCLRRKRNKKYQFLK